MGCAESRRAASARPRSRTRPVPRPRRARSRRERGSGWRRPVPIPLGRGTRRSLGDRADLDRAGRDERDALRDFDRLVEVLAVDEEVPADLLLRLGEWAVSHRRLAFAHAHDARAARVVELEPVELDPLLAGP